MQTMRNVLVFAILTLGGLTLAGASDVKDTSRSHEAHGTSGSHEKPDADAQAVGSNLPPKLRVLLIKEMLALTDASKQILEALVRGQDDVVARNAQSIHDSFILAQEMTDADRQAFHDSVPHAFIERDQALHELSARLAEAARKGDKSRQRELFAEMLDGCVGCHAAHATDRFPALAGGAR